MESALRQGAGEPRLKLIETLRVGSDPARLGLHRDRMARGARALGWPFDASRFDATLGAARSGAMGAGERLRLTLDRDGAFEVTMTRLAPAKAEWRLALASVRLMSTDPWLAIKSTNRTGYDAARAALAPGIDEALLCNERGEVCDGSITTVFFDRGQGLRTPPLTSGVLPGILRQEIACAEEVLLAEDLSDVRLWVGNALRGLIPAIWRG